MHAQDAFDQLDAILNRPIALKLVRLRFVFENADFKLGQNQFSQREDCMLIIRVDNDFVSESKAANSVCGTFRGCSFIKENAPVGWVPPRPESPGSGALSGLEL